MKKDYDTDYDVKRKPDHIFKHDVVKKLFIDK